MKCSECRKEAPPLEKNYPHLAAYTRRMARTFSPRLPSGWLCPDCGGLPLAEIEAQHASLAEGRTPRF